MGFFLVLIGIIILINGINKLNTAKEIKRNVEVEAEEVNAEKQNIFKRELVLEKKEKR
ncbi:hypothetical protein P7D93_18595 [Enterococcus raffinosus]|uniref:hypothetical protein n=1 Tax=Enterococcus raffinosus TaxID=71452 RepID=UPI00288D52D0|nr:hypothetical protein [Enterococcus raffinosus]MDT2531871.1 hypothetical protein [Enterococcus raffinosus]